MTAVKPQLFTWGLGKSGQLGTGKEQTEHTPQFIKLRNKASSTLKQVSCGALFTAVIMQDGDVFATGCGKYGRLGTGNEEDHVTFVPVNLPEKVTQISCGVWHAAAVTTSYGLLVWGHRKGCGTKSGQQSSSVLTPPSLVISPEEHKVVGVACGNNFTLAWTDEGRVLSWGSGHHGVLGHGSTDDIPSPKVEAALKDEKIVAASAGFFHSAFVTEDGKVFTCGKGSDGALGLGKNSLSDALTPKLVSFSENTQIASVSCSVGEHHGHTLALPTDGKVYSWGDGYKGKLGLDSQDSSYTPSLISPSHFNNEQVTVVCAGGIHSTASTAEGSVFTWGCGSDGRCGHPEGQGHRYLFRSDVPKKVEAFKSKFAMVSCTYYHSAAIVG
ncbi:uncharacterized protein [Littorina saxatilis]|uniref:RCC1-like domain-containing protein n=1 Tax=Littorina saxatilis TaxID=31220 RepID=A0AAN9BED4_9CAEN